MKTVGIVLAGGLSRRFGTPKAFAKLDGKYFYEYAMQALQPHCSDMIIVTRPELVAQFPGELNVITDDEAYFSFGPLVGIYSAMKNYEASQYIVLPCDMPYMKEDFIGELSTYTAESVIAVKMNERHHPLVSIWSRSVLAALKDTLDQKKLRVTPFLEKVQARWVNGGDFSSDSAIVLKNINRQTDLERGGNR